MEMNQIAINELNLKNSFFDSPHGLSNFKNYSSAADIARISIEVLKIPTLAKIVKWKSIKCDPVILSKDGEP